MIAALTRPGAGKLERLCAERHARDLELAARPGGHPRGLRFDPAAGERVVAFIEGYCRHHLAEWAGKPLLLESWQKDLIRQAFGWMRADGTRRYRIFYWEVPRKNGKSELAAAIALYLLVADREAGAEIYTTATKEKQARIVWDTAAAMVSKSPDLARVIKRSRSNLSVPRTLSKFEPLSAEHDTLDGLNPSGNVVDELHAHKTRGVWDVLDTAMGSRRQPVTLAITTAGTYDPESIGWQQHEHARQVLEGVIDDDAFHAFVACADEGDDHFAEATWRKANPNFGVSLKPSFIEDQAKKGRQQPSYLNTFLRLHLNVWTQQARRWLSVDQWNACDPSDPTRAVRAVALEREAALRGQVCHGGLDLSSKLDLAALVLLFPQPNNTVELVCRFFLPQTAAEAYSRKGQRFFDGWARDGWIITTPGDVIDYDAIRLEAMRLAEAFKLVDLAYDPWNATQIATQLQGEGLQMVETRQGFKTLSEASKDLEARIVAKQIRHMNNPVLRWNVANAVAVTDPSGNIRPDKAKASGRIDGVVATIMALGRANSATQEESGSYLDDGPPLMLG